MSSFYHFLERYRNADKETVAAARFIEQILAKIKRLVATQYSYQNCLILTAASKKFAE